MEKIDQIYKLHYDIAKLKTLAEQRTIAFVLHAEPIVSDGNNKSTRDRSLNELYENKID
ncbi:hypothetical protein C8Q73DRAFT_677035 [Cubamyces lactineus]|nr:hypothetical protein C8Q73DRAFT_677035 [Cubamyces lactineus]